MIKTNQKLFYVDKKTLVISLAVIIFFIASLYVGQKQQSNNIGNVKTYLYPLLTKQINDIDEIKIIWQGKTIKLANINSNWVLPDKYSYNADIGKIRELVSSVANLKIIEKKTSDKSKFVILGLEEPQSQTSTSTRIIFSSKNKGMIADFVTGKPRRTSNGMVQNALYVRKSQEDLAWLVEGDIETYRTVLEWASNELIDIAASEIASINFIFDANHENYTVIRKAKTDKDFVLKTVTDNSRKVKNQAQINALATSLVNLKFTDVRPAREINFIETRQVETGFQTFDGLLLKITTMQKDDKTNWIKIKASVLDKSNDSKKSIADNINNITGKWAYQINDYQASLLTTKSGKFSNE